MATGRARILFQTAATATALLLAATSATALTIELKDVAADRVERQRAAAAGALPLPGTPNVALFDKRLRDTGVSLTSPMLIRVFKAESEMEVWKERDGTFVLFATYPICHWSGSLGPKLREGDKQTPEGFYTITRQQTRHVGRWPRSIDIAYPNVLDQSLARTGSLILLHGGCSSVGCFAMTNPVMDEIHVLTTSAIAGGQEHVPIHVFPFRMTDKNITANVSSPWASFWANLKEGYDAFERTKLPPAVGICDGRYNFQPAASTWSSGPLQACEQTLIAIKDQDRWLRDVPQPAAMSPRYYEDVDEPDIPDEPDAPGVETRLGRDKQTDLRSKPKLKRVAIRCSMKRPSCRKFVALKQKAAERRRLLAMSGAQPSKSRKPAGGG